MSPPSRSTGRKRAGYTVAGIYEVEARRFLDYTLRWRNVPKPSIAAVQSIFEVRQNGRWTG